MAKALPNPASEPAPDPVKVHRANDGSISSIAFDGNTIPRFAKGHIAFVHEGATSSDVLVIHVPMKHVTVAELGDGE